MISKIKKWLDETHELSYREEDNLSPELYYKLWIFFNDGRTISISLDHFKNYSIQDCLVIGWLWRLDNLDKEALNNIQNTRVKQQFIESLNALYKKKNFKITAEYDGKCFSSISVFSPSPAPSSMRLKCPPPFSKCSRRSSLYF